MCIYITGTFGVGPESKALETDVNPMSQTAWFCAVRRPPAKGVTALLIQRIRQLMALRMAPPRGCLRT
jgi:hypothetical protein